MKRVHLSLLAIAAGLMLGGLSACNNINGAASKTTASSTAACVQGSGNQTTKNSTVSKFTGITIAADFKVTLKQDSSYGLSITADDNLFQYISTTVKNGTLTISTTKTICSPSNMSITIGAGAIQALTASGKDEIGATGNITAQNIAFNLTGADNVTLGLTATNVSTTISGQGNLNLTGQAASHKVTVSGKGTITALDFPVANYNFQTSGAGNYQINVSDTLSVHTTGSSVIKYKGNPTSITNDNKGSSTITKIN